MFLLQEMEFAYFKLASRSMNWTCGFQPRIYRSRRFSELQFSQNGKVPKRSFPTLDQFLSGFSDCIQMIFLISDGRKEDSLGEKGEILSPCWPEVNQLQYFLVTEESLLVICPSLQYNFWISRVHNFPLATLTWNGISKRKRTEYKSVNTLEQLIIFLMLLTLIDEGKMPWKKTFHERNSS